MFYLILKAYLPQKDWLGETTGLTKWPSIFYHDIAKYLSSQNSPAEFLHRLDCNYKEWKGYRYFHCDFVKEVFWHTVSEKSPVCFMKSKVTPSQRTSSTPYKVWVAVEKKDPGGKIHSAYCTCTAGLLGTCNHVTAMLFRVEAAVSSGLTKPTCTGKLCAWNVPKGSKTQLVMKPLKQLVFSTSTYRKKGDKNERKQNQDALQKYNAYHFEMDSDENMRQKLYETFKHSNPNSRFFELMESKRKYRGCQPKQKNMCILPDDLLTLAKKIKYDKSSTIESNTDIFKKSVTITQEQVKNIYDATQEQADSQVWVAQRKGRITASKFYHVFTRTNTIKQKPNETPKALIADLIERKSFSSVATKHGQSMEMYAKKSFTSILQKNHKIVKFIDNPGMTIDHNNPFLSVSPDAEGSCLCCGHFVVEIKCPYSICETVPTSDNLTYLYEVETENGHKSEMLKQNHSYYAQVQGQMAITGIKRAYFFVYTHTII